MDISHDEIRDELASQLEEEIRLPETLVKTEKLIDKPYYGSSVRADVVIKSTPIVEFEGIAFEVKTRSNKETRQQALRQLHGYQLGDYFPVFVAHRDVYDDNSGTTSPFKWVVRHLGASYVEVAEGDPVNFSLVDDRLPTDMKFPRVLE